MPFLRHSPSIDDFPSECSLSKSVPALPGRRHSNYRSSIVRFRLPLTPPQQGDMPPKYKEVSTKDAMPDLLKLGKSASRWGKQDLILLGVDYQYDKFDELKIPVNDMPEELVAGIFPLSAI